MTRKKIELSPENKQKVEQQFKPFTKLSSLAISKIFEHELCQSDIKVFLYLSIIDPFGDRWIDLPPTKTISDYLGISQSTFYRAISKLSEKEIIKIEDKGFRFKNNMPTAIPTDKDKSPPIGNNPHSQGNVLTDEDQSSNIGINPHSQGNRDSEPRQDKGFSDSQTSKTIQTSPDLPDSVQEAQRDELSSFEEERQEGDKSNSRKEEEIAEAIKNSLDLDKEFDNQHLAEENYHLAEQQYNQSTSNNFPVCCTSSDSTENPMTPICRSPQENTQDTMTPICRSPQENTQDPIIPVRSESSEDVSIEAECPKNYEECSQEFLQWKAKDWANYFGYSVKQGMQNLKTHLRNKPQKIAEYWEDWQVRQEVQANKKHDLVYFDGRWMSEQEMNDILESRKPKNDEEIPINEKFVGLLNNFLNTMTGKTSYAT